MKPLALFCLAVSLAALVIAWRNRQNPVRLFAELERVINTQTG